MNISRLIIVVTSFVFLLVKISVRSENKLGLEVSFQEPDHLLPVNPYPSKESKEYNAQVKSRLGLGGFSFAKMTVLPSFSGEYGVRLDGVKRGKNATSDKVVSREVETTEKFLLTYSVANKSIWRAMPWNNINRKEQQETLVTTTSVEIPSILAKEIYQVWKRVILQTRYSYGNGGGNDGTVYEFGLRYSIYGEIWSPDLDKAKSPALFIKLGSSLIDYCKASPTDRLIVAEKIKINVDLLQKYLDEKEKQEKVRNRCYAPN